MLDRLVKKTGWPPGRLLLIGWLFAGVLVFGALSLVLNGGPVLVGALLFAAGAVVVSTVAMNIMTLKEQRYAQRRGEETSGG